VLRPGAVRADQRLSKRKAMRVSLGHHRFLVTLTPRTTKRSVNGQPARAEEQDKDRLEKGCSPKGFKRGARPIKIHREIIGPYFND
jgi:hypothetical protein